MRQIPTLAGLVALVACADTAPAPLEPFTAPIVLQEARVEVSRGSGPPDAEPNACYAREITPAVIETVTEQVMLQPPQIDRNGQVREPAVFVTETQQRIVEERRELWFETPCAAEDDPEFIAALQRALQVRGFYRGTPSGEMDRRTRLAIHAYQAPQGLESGVLSLAAARQLGLVLWDPEAAAIGADT